MGHDRTQFLHSGLWGSGNNHQGRTRQQCLLQGQSDQHGPTQAWGIAASVRRIPHAAVRLCLSGRHFGRTPTLRGNLSERAMDAPMREAYRELEEDMRKALKAHRGNRSVLSTTLNTLLLYPDHPYGIGTLYGTEFDPELKRKVRFVIAEPRDLPEDRIYSKERRLIEEIKNELAEGRRCQVFAVYTQKHDVTARLQRILCNEGLRTAVLRASVDTSKREAWYARQVKDGVQVVICHPKLVETGLDLLDFPTIIF